jgi:hypothetical protein
MKPFELLSSLPGWTDAPPAKLLASPAWALPCRFGETAGSLRLGAIRPTDTLNLRIALENEEHVLGIADSPAFPELHAVWHARSDVPEPILLALVEKECAPLLQLLENAVRRQLRVIGLAPDADGGSDASWAMQVVASGNGIAVFTLSSSPALTQTFGNLRFIDLSHPAVRDLTLDAAVELASFSLNAGDNPETGDALLLPELDLASGTATVRLVVSGVLAAQAETGVSPWTDEGRFRVVRAERAGISFGALADFASGKVAWADTPVLASLGSISEGLAVELVHGAGRLASGRLVRLGDRTAFQIDAVG